MSDTPKTETAPDPIPTVTRYLEIKARNPIEAALFMQANRTKIAREYAIVEAQSRPAPPAAGTLEAELAAARASGNPHAVLKFWKSPSGHALTQQRAEARKGNRK